MNEPYDSTKDTRDHIARVEGSISRIADLLRIRGAIHDESKLKSPEKEMFDVATPKLAGLTYGSDEYKAALAEMGEALEHHYQANSHHPEHFRNSIEGMSLLDLVEMFCDWRAASQRHADGDFSKSLEINRERFGVSKQLANVFENTRKELGW